MKKFVTVLLIIALLAMQVVAAFAAPNMESNGKGNGHKKGLESHEKERNGNAWGHVKHGCTCCDGRDEEIPN